MARRDYSGIKNTCHKIDEVISFIENFINDENYSDQANEAIKIMELIRDANSELRDWGNVLFERCEELGDEKDVLESNNSELTNENSSLQKEVDNLRTDNDTLNNEIESLNNTIEKLQNDINLWEETLYS